MVRTQEGRIAATTTRTKQHEDKADTTTRTKQHGDKADTTTRTAGRRKETTGRDKAKKHEGREEGTKR